MGGISEYLYSIRPDESVANINDFYTPILQGILAAKLVILGVRGGGFIRDRVRPRPYDDIPVSSYTGKGVVYPKTNIQSKAEQTK